MSRLQNFLSDITPLQDGSALPCFSSLPKKIQFMSVLLVTLLPAAADEPINLISGGVRNPRKGSFWYEKVIIVFFFSPPHLLDERKPAGGRSQYSDRIARKRRLVLRRLSGM